MILALFWALQSEICNIKKFVYSSENCHVEMAGDILTVSQTYTQDGDLMCDPIIDLRVDYDNQKVIPISFENSGDEALQKFALGNMTPKMAKKMNDVLRFMNSTMLENIEQREYKSVDMDKDRDRNNDDISR